MMCRNGQGMTRQATAAGERRCLLRNASGHVVEGVAKIQRLAKVDAADVGGIAEEAVEQTAIAGHVAGRSERTSAIEELPQLGAADRGVCHAREA